MKMVFGGLLLAIGILIAGASGLCSLYVVFSPGGSMGERLSTLPLVLLFGGLPFALGVVFVIGGRSLILRARQDEGDPNVP
jgi:hypothetical protein